MKAFLSHSSRDKHSVNQVAEILGVLQVELDEHSFEYTFNTQAIRNGLERSDVFVYFLSTNSTTSSFIKEEQRGALEARGKGIIKKILIFALDTTSHKALPAWMQELNIVKKTTSPRACARQIQATLLELAAEDDPGLGLYLGRDEDEKAFRKALIVPPAKTPVAIHIVGHHGIGRRTFLSKTFQKLFPRDYAISTEVTLGPYEGAEELYRRLYALHRSSSLEETIADFENFAGLGQKEQAHHIATIINEMSKNGEFVFVIDEGGVFTEDGEYQEFIQSVLSPLSDLNRPSLLFIQTRMMPYRTRAAHLKSFHQYLRPLPNDVVAELITLSFREMEIEFDEVQVAEIVKLLDGHPYNIRFAVNFCLNYGVDNLIQDPSDLVEWKNRRAIDFLGKIQFTDLEAELIAVLSEYQYLPSATLVEILKSNATDLARAIRRMQEFCCVERREGYFYISAPIRDGIRRDSRFSRSDEWKQKVAQEICDMVTEYTDEDSIPISIVDTATLAAARSKTPPAFLSSLILPSHLIKLARDAYDASKRGLCIDLCERAFSMRDRLPIDAHVEILRLWALSAIRNGDVPLFESVLTRLRTYSVPVAIRNVLFLEGFDLRRRGQLDPAESKFIQAWKMARNNQSINRELASLYCKQRRYADAETHARAAYESAPTNPFIIDIFAETLLGKWSVRLPVDRQEIDKVIEQLRIYGDAPGSSFYLIRDAQHKQRVGDTRGGLRVIGRAIERTPALLAPYFIRAEMLLADGDPDGADRDLQEVNRLLDQAGGFSEGDEARAQELEIRIMMERAQFAAAKDKISRSAFISRAVKERLLRVLAQAIAYDPQHADITLQEWAKSYGSKPAGKDNRSSRGRNSHGVRQR